MDLIINFVNVSPTDAQFLAADLRKAILNAHRDLTAEKRRDDESTMDFGGGLVIAILNSAAAAALIAVLRNWLSYIITQASR